MRQDPMQPPSDDAEANRPQGEGLARHAGMLLRWAGGLVSLGLIVMIVVWSYRLGVRDANELPVIQARSDPARIRPENPGGDEVPHQGMEVNEVLAGAPPDRVTTEATAPQAAQLSPEDQPVVPRTRPQVVVAGSGRQDSPAQAEPDAAPDVAALEPDVPAVAAPEAPDAAAATDAPAEDEPDLGSLIDQLVAEVVTEEASTQDSFVRPRLRPSVFPPFPTPPPEREPADEPALGPLGLLPPGEPVASARITPEASSSDARPTLGTLPVAPLGEPEGQVFDIEELENGPAEQTAARQFPSGSRLVQLGEFANASLARTAWEELSAVHDDLLGGRSWAAEDVTLGGVSFTRLRVFGFRTLDDADALCEALRARGVECVAGTVE